MAPHAPINAEQVQIYPAEGLNLGVAFGNPMVPEQAFLNAVEAPANLFPPYPVMYAENPAFQLAEAFQFFQAPPMLYLPQNPEDISDEELNVLEFEAREISANLARFAADFGTFALQVSHLRGNRNGA